jgi:hypothetical protein
MKVRVTKKATLDEVPGCKGLIATVKSIDYRDAVYPVLLSFPKAVRRGAVDGKLTRLLWVHTREIQPA